MAGIPESSRTFPRITTLPSTSSILCEAALILSRFLCSKVIRFEVFSLDFTSIRKSPAGSHRARRFVLMAWIQMQLSKRLPQACWKKLTMHA